MELKKQIKIECIRKGVTISFLSSQLGMNSSQLLYHHISRKNNNVLKKIEEVLELEKGTFSQ